MRCADCRDLLDRYQDGELPPAESVELREHLEGCPDCVRARDALAATSHLLKDGLVRYPAPDVLKARIRSALSRESASLVPARRRWWRLAAAGAAIAVASSALTFATVHRAEMNTVTDEVLASHIRSLMPGHLVDVASTDQHNVKPWFNGRVDLSPPVPKLDTAGFVLIGGRLDYLRGRSVAALVYSRRQHMINVYAWPESGADAAAAVTSAAHGYHLVHWQQDGEELWAVSDLNAAELSQFVALFQRTDSSPERAR
jgi:anti-sigma factor (TIGR02949 family)